MDQEFNKLIDKFYEQYQGANDNRSDEEKLLDYNQAEFVTSANEVIWIKKRKDEFRSFPELNQFFTSKCVAFTTAKLALINFWLKTKEFLFFSPNSIYDYRVNKPSGGMIGNDAFDIWKDKGISLESVCKSNQIQESDPIEVSLFAKEVAKGFKLGEHITIPNGDFDRVASTIQTTGKGVMTWFYFTSREWGRDVPKIMDNLVDQYDPRASRHSVATIDFGIASEILTVDGQQVLKIEDSAHFGGKSVRYITREFFNARNFLIKYPMNFVYEENPVPIIPKITKTLRFGMTDPEVKILQERLKAKGFFPSNINTTQLFGSITLTAVKNFQKANNLSSDGVVGPLTILKVNL